MGILSSVRANGESASRLARTAVLNSMVYGRTSSSQLRPDGDPASSVSAGFYLGEVDSFMEDHCSWPPQLVHDSAHSSRRRTPCRWRSVADEALRESSAPGRYRCHPCSRCLPTRSVASPGTSPRRTCAAVCQPCGRPPAPAPPPSRPPLRSLPPPRRGPRPPRHRAMALVEKGFARRRGS